MFWIVEMIGELEDGEKMSDSAVPKYALDA